MDRNKSFRIKSKSHGRVVINSVVLAPGETSKVIDPTLSSEKFLNKIEAFERKGSVKLDYNVKQKTEKSAETETKEVKTTKNSKGEQRSHTVYNPNEKAINVKENDVGKAMEVKQVDNTQNKAVEVEFGEIDKIEAREFLDQHWKTVEKEVQKIKSKRKLKLYLSVADEDGNGAKKQAQLVQNRLDELEEE